MNQGKNRVDEATGVEFNSKIAAQAMVHFPGDSVAVRPEMQDGSQRFITSSLGTQGWATRCLFAIIVSSESRMDRNMKSDRLAKQFLRDFEKAYDPDREARAVQSRGEFLAAFPVERLSRLKRDDYVIGLQKPTFCDRVEVRTRPWAVIQGATALKFGIYFGKKKGESTKRYHHSSKFGADENSAFRAVRSALVDLVSLGDAEELDFRAIDANPLSQLFKAKILSLYFPERFINVCSDKHLVLIGKALGLIPNLPVSQYQHLIIQVKNSNSLTRSWSNPKFTAFLYRTIVRPEPVPDSIIRKPSKKPHRKVNFEDVQRERDRIGKAAEAFARKWEEDRLRGADLPHLVGAIVDRREQPGYGYDFMSHSAPNQPRYIEVKSVGKVAGEGYRFFLSDNERFVSQTGDHADSYFFYLVFFDGKGQPISLKTVLAAKMYEDAEILPASYTVRFTVEHV